MEDAMKFWGGGAKQRGFVWGRAVIVLSRAAGLGV